jgi:L-lactate dehydrogenase complex protein LldG
MKRVERVSTSARDAVLQAIRRATGEPAAANLNQAGSDWSALPRLYRTSYKERSEETLALLIERLADYDAVVERASDAKIAEAAERLLHDQGVTKLLMPEGFPQRWRPQGIAINERDSSSAVLLESFDGVLTTATLGIAETGTLVLTHGPGQGRRALSLLPDHHLCILRATDVVATVPEAFARLASDSRSPITFISGPSATADIEMTRIKGVHGPRFLTVLLVD